MTQQSATARCANPSEPITAEQRAAFERDGYVIIRAGSLGPDGSMHLPTAVANCPEVASLIDHPATFGYVWSTLGWNIHIGRRQAEPRDRNGRAAAAVDRILGARDLIGAERIRHSSPKEQRRHRAGPRR